MAGKRKLKKANDAPQAMPAPLRVMNPDDDEQLMSDLMNQLDSRDKVVATEAATVLNDMDINQRADELQKDSKQRSKGRFLARQARKAAAFAQSQMKDDPEAEARLQREAGQEEKTIRRICDELDMRIHQINADGHCLYSAVADQLALLSILPPAEANYRTTRFAASAYIWTHPHDFLPFLSADDSAGSETGFMSPLSFERYCAAIRDTGVWGGEPEILALSRAYNVPIHVVQGETPHVVVHNPTGAPGEGDVSDKERKVVRLSYHRRLYGLGEHYNSLRPKGKLFKSSPHAV